MQRLRKKAPAKEAKGDGDDGVTGDVVGDEVNGDGDKVEDGVGGVRIEEEKGGEVGRGRDVEDIGRVYEAIGSDPDSDSDFYYDSDDYKDPALRRRRNDSKRAARVKNRSDGKEA